MSRLKGADLGASGPAVEVFFTAATTTVSSGGTTAPAAGTTETWTVASSALFADVNGNTADTLANRVFRVVDSALSSEVILVTNVSGTTWSVTRGADGTTPVAHTAGFTVACVPTATSLAVLNAAVANAKIAYVMGL